VTDRSTHAAEVLAGRRPPRRSEHGGGLGAASNADGLVAAVGAVGLALFTLRRRRVSELPGLPVAALKGVHSGVVGDYVAWLVAGVAAVGGLFALLLR
jgi:multicomponent Na+:H+ antiporter subunit D